MKEIWPLVIKDMNERDQTGRKSYGVPLTSETRIDPLLETYFELLDACVYIRRALYDRDGR